MTKQDTKYQDAAKALKGNVHYVMLRQAMIEQLSEPSLNILDRTDTVVARSHVHDVGIRNFFRWVDKTSEGASQSELLTTLQPFNHYGETEENK